MTREKLWGRSELNSICTAEAITTLGVSYPLTTYFLQFGDHGVRIIGYAGFVVWPLLYLVLLAVQAILSRRDDLPPKYMVALAAPRFAIASFGLASSLLRFCSQLWWSKQLPLLGRFGAAPLPDLALITIWWLASLNGLALFVGAWRLHWQRAQSTALRQFDFRVLLSLWSVELVRWAGEYPGDRSSWLQRLKALAARMAFTTLGSLGIHLGWAAQGQMRGEPRVRMFTLWFTAGGDDLSKDPDATDYTRVYPGGAADRVATDSYQDISDVRREHGDAHSLRTLDDEVSDYEPTSPRASTSSETGYVHDDTSRRLRPRFLCVVDKTEPAGYRVEPASEGSDFDAVQYIFMSYTRMHFRTDIQGDPSAAVNLLPGSDTSTQTGAGIVTAMALDAVAKAGVGAFWLDFLCLKPEKVEDPEASRNIADVYQICDIVRGSYSMAIATGPLSNAEPELADYSSSARRGWLRQYGDRLWTLPEALLCPSNHGIPLYFKTSTGFDCEQIEKRNLAERIWSDARITRGLLEHYEGTLALSQIDFISLALQCLQRRQTVTRMPADIIYALMGLMRERVPVREKQSAFEAFAHLSLANDSQKPLERLFCMSKSGNGEDHEWHDMSDAWGAHIRDVQPLCDVVGVAERDTVRIANMCAAIIHWAPLPAVRFELACPRRKFLWRLQRTDIASVRKFLVVLWVVALFDVTAFQYLWIRGNGEYSSYLAAQAITNVQLALFGVPILAMFVIAMVCLPTWVWTIYGGDIKAVEARFLGFEGVPNLSEVEETLFGRDCGRLKRSALNRQGSIHDAASDPDGGNVYTIVDTWLLTAHTFHASTRPSVVAIPGKHRGVLRAMLCSYDDVEGVYHRENVLRIDEQVLGRMPKMDAARFSLLRKPVYYDDDRPRADEG